MHALIPRVVVNLPIMVEPELPHLPVALEFLLQQPVEFKRAENRVAHEVLEILMYR